MNIQKLYAEIEKYSQKYELSFQFWGKGNMNVFIEKGGVDLTSFGGRDTIKEILVDTIEWIYRVNNVPKEKQYKESAQTSETIINPHICPQCSWQCTCSDQPCSCCGEPIDRKLHDEIYNSIADNIGNIVIAPTVKRCIEIAKQYAASKIKDLQKDLDLAISEIVKLQMN